ncbi:MAG: GNAT family N-acetyltransferase [Crocinitomicaceae bacterium]|nr:GNAT family N-acetyltransferase [Crocinitomicaceae bacterium]
MQIIFRQVQESELPIVLANFKAAAEKIGKMNVDHWQYWKNPPEEKVKWVEEGIGNGEYYFLDLENGEPLGTVRILDEDLLYWGPQSAKAKYVHSLVINEVHNGKGYGQKVLEEVARKGKTDNCSYLRLDADAKNLKLCSYYENLGFEKVGERELSLSVYNLYEKAIF